MAQKPVIIVTPVEGQRCPFPGEPGKPIRWVPAAGARVRDSNYWRRREAAGAVAISAPPASAPDSSEGQE